MIVKCVVTLPGFSNALVVSGGTTVLLVQGNGFIQFVFLNSIWLH